MDRIDPTEFAWEWDKIKQICASCKYTTSHVHLGPSTLRQVDVECDVKPTPPPATTPLMPRRGVDAGSKICLSPLKYLLPPPPTMGPPASAWSSMASVILLSSRLWHNASPSTPMTKTPIQIPKMDQTIGSTQLLDILWRQSLVYKIVFYLAPLRFWEAGFYLGFIPDL